MNPINVYRQSRVEAIAYVDDIDLPLIAHLKWSLHSDCYAQDGRGRLMHRVIMQPPSGMDVDQLDHDRLNNRRSNLRVVSRSVNSLNRILTPALGVYFDTSKQRWIAKIKVNKKSRYIGAFLERADAITARFKAVQQVWSEQGLPVPAAISAMYEQVPHV